MIVFKQCLNGTHRIPTDDYHCEQCEMNWEGDETGKWAEHYFKKWEELRDTLAAVEAVVNGPWSEDNLIKIRTIIDNQKEAE